MRLEPHFRSPGSRFYPMPLRIEDLSMAPGLDACGEALANSLASRLTHRGTLQTLADWERCSSHTRFLQKKLAFVLLGVLAEAIGTRIASSSHHQPGFRQARCVSKGFQALGKTVPSGFAAHSRLQELLVEHRVQSVTSTAISLLGRTGSRSCTTRDVRLAPVLPLFLKLGSHAVGLCSAWRWASRAD